MSEDAKKKQKEKEQAKKEAFATFMNAQHELFNRHVPYFQKADDYLADREYEQFKDTYKMRTHVELSEMVQAQHTRLNEVSYQLERMRNTFMDMLRDVSKSNTLEEFEATRKRAQWILRGQDLMNRGVPRERVVETMTKESPLDEQTSKIILT